MATRMTIGGAMIVAALALALSGCSSVGRSERTRDTAARQQTVEAGSVRLETLSAQPLRPGQCGLFLWAQSSQQPAYVFMAYNEPAVARIRPNGRERSLQRTAAEGRSASGVFESQTFSDDRLTVAVDVTFDPNRVVQDGAVVERGVIRVRDEGGWETVIPVGGLAACQR